MLLRQKPNFQQSSLSISAWRRRLVRVAGWLGRLADFGTGGYPPEVRRRLKILNLVAYLIAFATFIYLLQQVGMDYRRYRPIIWLNMALIPLVLAIPLTHRFSAIAGGLLLLGIEYVAQLLFIAHLGNQSGMQLHFFVAAAAPFVVLGLERLWLVIICIVTGLMLHLFAWFWFPPSASWLDPEPEVLRSLYIQAAITTMGLLAATVWYAFSLAEKARAETDSLMRRILPEKIVERLKAEPGVAIADSKEAAAVLFSDISGFVALARRLGAAETVSVLNRMVSEFDRLAAAHGVEKIKTIGDAYMAVAGVPEAVPDPCARVVRLAIEMQRTMARLRRDSGLELRMRVGIASGPVMAGVIGTDKFTYDVWGDAVNLAARLEQAGSVGRVHICRATHAAISKDFRCEPHGTLDIKGVGPQQTWFLDASLHAEP
ncbi:MAG: adenylate/guanylate cyclase domain-containing protein [Hyphomicrobiaceae bacterium]|nr:MAG: adenylate/guanylate cyclase domain-containing protein [Hyphomicrobiaceae bacterium]